MARTKRAVYSTEFRTAAVKRAEAGEKASGICADLKISPQTLRNWVSAARNGGHSEQAKTASALREENAKLAMEKDLLMQMLEKAMRKR